MVSRGKLGIFLDKEPIHWKTFKQRVVSLSTMEAEFVAMVETTKEIIWLHNVLTECFECKIITGNKEKPIHSCQVSPIPKKTSRFLYFLFVSGQKMKSP